MNEHITQLLNINNKALKFAHDACGFDFQNDFFITSGEGRFTYNTITKAISENITSPYTAIVMVKSNRSYNDKKLFFVAMDKGKFSPLRMENISYWNYNIDYFFSVGDFENARKNCTEKFFIIAQKKEFITTIEKSKNIDLYQRFKYLHTPYNKAGDGKGNTWINSLNLMLLDGSANKIIYDPAPERTNDLNKIIDKSGYLVCVGRNELKNRASRLRAERAKNKALATDYTERETAIYNTIEEAKQKIAKNVVNAFSYDEMDKVEKAVNTLRWVIFSMGTHAEYRQNKHYRSVGEIENRLSNIESKLKEI